MCGPPRDMLGAAKEEECRGRQRRTTTHPWDRDSESRDPPRACRLRRHHRAALLPRVPDAARAAPRVVRALLARGALHPGAAVRCAGHPPALRHGRAHRLGRCPGKAAGLRSRTGRGALLRLHAHARASAQVRRSARCASPVRALAGGSRTRAAGRGGGGCAGAADPLAASVAPVQPGRHPGPGVLPASRFAAGPASPASDAVYQGPGGSDPRPAAAQRGRGLQRDPAAEEPPCRAATCCWSTT